MQLFSLLLVMLAATIVSASNCRKITINYRRCIPKKDFNLYKQQAASGISRLSKACNVDGFKHDAVDDWYDVDGLDGCDSSAGNVVFRSTYLFWRVRQNCGPIKQLVTPGDGTMNVEEIWGKGVNCAVKG